MLPFFASRYADPRFREAFGLECRAVRLVREDMGLTNLEAVTRTIAAAIRGALAAGRPIGICGQAPSDFPEIARFLVSEGVDSISLDPSAVLRILPVLVEAERALPSAAAR